MFMCREGGTGQEHNVGFLSFSMSLTCYVCLCSTFRLEA